ncbi:hypothetical protein NIES2135_53980 [Leptolyngbya boryana NIES-2135]|jgi:hypothetical protein|uniref:Uncharacterized protein n=1 Tax=Leptolyngbya boryana NIES-2135 TaxID=1973484 RepID=A0A1Z4JP30_LEPBY|nr:MULTISPECIES: hypothetical protein [Leptolyngbya]BAY58525.1 hypothetical protein NIES2135_53980 [Leptolyngbya boryana NIES-2135]MBD2370793.1 hypothetical protein [Leptolyngbya sp. FACHB-161]MBD2377054.1 hypothetical protein [Leptolyngbya sp. FACHB-238]MBD2401497.1 hypothetical protein [Leptolyngbya sp. FACHB-239]MBD2408049.1 hypothetical protein [Leptolyngbya sp. FACHB-402]
MLHNHQGIDKDVFFEKMALLCDLNQRPLLKAETLAAYYESLSGNRAAEALATPITTEEFIEIADYFFCIAHFPSPKDFINTAIELRALDKSQNAA